MSDLATPPTSTLPGNQRMLVVELGVDADGLSERELVTRIETLLGDRASLECARWYVLSVMRHLTGMQWFDPVESGVPMEQQYELAQKCLASPGYVQSIKAVLKSDVCKYALVEFRRKRKLSRRILANTTVAFACAREILDDAQLLVDRATEVSAKQAPDPVHRQGTEVDLPEVTTASLRRAGRRGFTGEAAHQELQTPAFKAEIDRSSQAVTARLTPQEYAELEQALARQKSHSGVQLSWQDFGTDESRSWLLGMIAGLVLFAGILLLFL